MLNYSREPAKEGTEKAGYHFYQFRVNQGGNKDQDIELRLELRDTDATALQNRPIIYWQINHDEIDNIKDKLERLGYKLLDEDAITASGKEAKRFIAESPEGNLIAGHTNPPFPFLKQKLSRQRPKRATEFVATVNPTVKLLASLALGPMLLGVVRLLRARNRG